MMRGGRRRAPFRVQQFLQDEAKRVADLAKERASITFQPESGADTPGRPAT